MRPTADRTSKGQMMSLAEDNRLVAALRELDEARAYEPDRTGLEKDWYGRYSCGCTWDSGPYEVPCDDHDRDARIETAIDRLRAALEEAQRDEVPPDVEYDGVRALLREYRQRAEAAETALLAAHRNSEGTQ